MNTLGSHLGPWRERLQERLADIREEDAAQLIADADAASLADMRRQQAANRNAAYVNQRPTRYASANFDLLRPDQNPNGMVSRWLPAGPRTLLIAGPSRTGKTTAAYAIGNAAHQGGTWVMARTAVSLSAALKPDSTEPMAFNYAISCPLLIIDDLGRERVTDWWLEQLHRIVDDRCSNELRLVVTANTSAVAGDAYAELVARYGDPIVERLIDGGGVLVFDGPAVRRVVTEW